MIDKQQSHVFGKELINNLKQQNAQLKKQNKLHKEKLGIAKKEAKILRNKLKAEGVKFDGDNIANYNAKLEAAEKKINALIKKYNGLSAAEQKKWDEADKKGKGSPLKKAEEYYENLKKQMDKYTDYMSTVYSEEEAMQDALFQQIENNLKAYEVKIEVKLDMSEARRTMNNFLKNMSIDIKNMYKTSAEWATTFKTSEKDAKADKDDINTKLKQLEDYKKASVGGENKIHDFAYSLALQTILENRSHSAIKYLISTKNYDDIASQLFMPVLNNSTVISPLDFDSMIEKQLQELISVWNKNSKEIKEEFENASRNIVSYEESLTKDMPVTFK